MPVHGRSARRLLIVLLALPVVLAIYLSAGFRALAGLPRLLAVAFLGLPVIGFVYADEARRRAPAGLRQGLEHMPVPRATPLRSALVMAMAVALLATSASATPAVAAKPATPAEAMIQAARAYVGKPYRLGTEGPRLFDCSGLIFRAFADIGALPRIGGGRAKAVTYMRWFEARGLATKRDGERGDLVVWGDGLHIGIYLGNGKVISALADQGVAVHGLHSISLKFTTFLKVSWKAGDGKRSKPERPADEDKPKNRGGGSGGEEAGTDSQPELTDAEEVGDGSTLTGLATGTMNLRREHDPQARIVGWVDRGSRFTITGTGRSPSGALWYSIELRNGKSGWVYSRWVTPLAD
ncbi:MAG TPA: NlpC/P60 family protein [Candidatus Limnocylindria bacterium]|nr:NlpC/P60 family protein [Candidatus Limnocylindria bacterium]